MRPKLFTVSLFAVIITMVISFGSGRNAGLLAQGTPAATQPAAGQERNRVLLPAASPFEDLIEAALANDAQGIRHALKACGDRAAAVNQALSPPARLEMASLLAGMRQSEQKKDYQNVALQAVEAYRVLVGSLDAQSLVVPVQVAWLDYVGFKLKVLLQATPPDWPAIQQTVESGSRHWFALEGQVGDKGLRDAVKLVIAGLNQATLTKNPEMAVFAAQMDLALVDLLEAYFERTGK
jgi:hypothetical protein